MTTDACGSGSPSPLSMYMWNVVQVRERHLRVKARMCINRAHKEDEKARPQFKPMPCTCMANREPCSSNLHAVERGRANDNRTPFATQQASLRQCDGNEEDNADIPRDARDVDVEWTMKRVFFSIVVIGSSKRSELRRRDIRMAKQRKPATDNCMAKDFCKVWNPSRKGAAGQRGDASKCRTNTGRRNPNERF